MSTETDAPVPVVEEDATSAIDPRLLQTQAGVGGYLRALGSRFRGGDLGSLPVVVGLVLIWIIFQTQNSRFLSAGNLENLALQNVDVGVIAIGIVLVLLLGEIDLSVGSVSGVCACLMGVLLTQHHVAAPLALLAALGLGAAIGFIHGVVFAKIGIPAFVVTLAGLLGWAGLQLHLVGTSGSVALPYGGSINEIQTTFLSKTVGWILGIVVVALYVMTELLGAARRKQAGLRAAPPADRIVKLVIMAAGTLVAIGVANSDRGVPLSVLIFLALVVGFQQMLTRTKFGRHIYAVGGNAEAARRAGISVTGIRIAVMTLAGLLASVGGILAASRLQAVSASTGGNAELLNAIAAAVIGGTSLTGGRGRAWSALLGILVIGSIANGLDLLSIGSDVREMITGGVLLAAVAVDALARRGRQASGRA
jgi:D-xylose transport system permease protein